MPELQFDLFDPEAEVDVSERQLPHWFQPGVITFVTFRTADSIPQSVLQLWLEELVNYCRCSQKSFLAHTGQGLTRAAFP